MNNVQRKQSIGIHETWSIIRSFQFVSWDHLLYGGREMPEVACSHTNHNIYTAYLPLSFQMPTGEIMFLTEGENIFFTWSHSCSKPSFIYNIFFFFIPFLLVHSSVYIFFLPSIKLRDQDFDRLVYMYLCVSVSVSVTFFLSWKFRDS